MYELNESYLNAYNSRINSKGHGHKDRELNYGIANFEKFLLEHPSSEKVVIDGCETIASIASNKQDQYKMTKEILTRLSDKITPGSIVDWKDFKWIVYQKECQPNQAYNSCFMTKSNYTIKWIDNYGVEHEQFAYILSSKDSIIKQNFRTWNRLITPQPNQYLEILVPDKPAIAMGQKFLINERAWFVDEYDNTSVPGLTYYSLTEDKIDRLDDDLKSGLANWKDKGMCVIRISDIYCQLGSKKPICPVVYLNDKVINESLDCIVYDETIAGIVVDEKGTAYVTPLKAGKTRMKLYLTDHPEVATTINIVISNTSVDVYEIVGDNELRVTDSAIYTLNKIGAALEVLPIDSFEISDTTLATGKIINQNQLKLFANTTNKLGVVELTMYYQGQSYKKNIKIRSLW